VDVGDRGDEYNFCPVEEDVVISASSVKPLVCLTEYGSVRQTLEVSLLYRVPAGLGETRGQRSEELVELPITTRLSLISGVPRLEIETTIDNNAADHRIRAHFPVPVRVDRFQTEGHLDVIARAIDLPEDTEAWVEQPAPTHPQRTWTDVSDGQVGLMVANRGLPEIEVLRTHGGSEIALTLLRCVGWLSRGDMSVRQGHAGPGLPTPEAQCIGEYTFRYALIPHAGDWQEAFAEAHAFAVPMRAVSTGSHAGTLLSRGNFVEIGPKGLVVTAIKEAEAGRGLVVRFWNTSAESREAEVKLWKRPSRAVQCNLAERAIRTLGIDGDGVVCVPARGREIVTLLFTFE
jgi:alpha-mannosidase